MRRGTEYGLLAPEIETRLLTTVSRDLLWFALRGEDSRSGEKRKILFVANLGRSRRDRDPAPLSLRKLMTNRKSLRVAINHGQGSGRTRGQLQPPQSCCNNCALMQKRI